MIVLGLLLAASNTGWAQERVKLVDPPVGLALRIESTTTSKGGSATVKGGGGASRSEVSLTRKRLLERRHLDDALGGKVTYRVLADRIVSGVDGREESKAGPLDGLTLEGMKNGAGNWVFTPSQGTLRGDAVSELDLLAAFENRRWLPGREVAVGESWEFSPGFIRASLRRDVASAQVVGMMKLRAVEKRADGVRVAVIDCSIRGGGRERTATDAEAGAEGNLVGVITVNLDQPGHIAWHLNGTLLSGSRAGDTESVVRLPMTLKLVIQPLGS